MRGDQVTQVRGYADQLLRVKNNPYDPSNRRISILVKNEGAGAPRLDHAKVVDGKTGLPKVESRSGSPGPANVQPGDAAKAAAPAQSSAAKPVMSAGAAKPGMMARIKQMLPGRK